MLIPGIFLSLISFCVSPSVSKEFRGGVEQPYIKKIMGKNAPKPSEMPNADHIHSYGLYMGNYPELGKESIDYIANQIANCWNG